MTENWIKIVYPGNTRIVIYDDKKGYLYYLFPDKKEYLKVNPGKEKDKKVPADRQTFKYAKWKNKKHKSTLPNNYEEWFAVYFNHDKTGKMQYYGNSIIDKNIKYPSALIRMEIAERTLRTKNPDVIKAVSNPSEFAIFTVMCEFNGLNQIEMAVLEYTDSIDYIKIKQSEFEIPKDYKNIGWNPNKL